MLCSRLSGVELVKHAWQGLRSGVLVSPQGGGPVVWTWRSNCGTCSYITLCSTGRTIIHLWHFSLNFTTISKYQHLLNRLLLSGEWKSVCIRQLIAGKKKSFSILLYVTCQALKIQYGINPAHVETKFHLAGSYLCSPSASPAFMRSERHLSTCKWNITGNTFNVSRDWSWHKWWRALLNLLWLFHIVKLVWRQIKMCWGTLSLSPCCGETSGQKQPYVISHPDKLHSKKGEQLS